MSRVVTVVAVLDGSDINVLLCCLAGYGGRAALTDLKDKITQIERR